MTSDERGVSDLIAAAKEWSDARKACLAVRELPPGHYDRLAQAEAALQRAADLACMRNGGTDE